MPLDFLDEFWSYFPRSLIHAGLKSWTVLPFVMCVYFKVIFRHSFELFNYTFFYVNNTKDKTAPLLAQ